MPNITDLTQTVGSAFNSQSLYFYAVWNGDDYRIDGSHLQRLLGTTGGVIVHNSNSVGVSNATEGPISFNTVAYEEGAGWTDSNSTTCIFAPRPMILLLGATISQIGGDGIREFRIVKNNSEDNNTQWPTKYNYGHGTGPTTLMTYPYAADSGDLFTCRYRNETGGTRSIGTSYFWARPIGFL